MSDYFWVWSAQSSSGNRSDTPVYLERKASETYAILRDYCDYSTEPVVDLGCGAGELLVYLLGSINIVKAVDYSESMLSAAKLRLCNIQLQSAPEFVCAGVDILSDLSEGVWISTGALSQYSSRDQLREIISCFQQNNSAKHLILFDTIDPVRFLMLPLIAYSNDYDSNGIACEPNERINKARLAKMLVFAKRLLRILVYVPFSTLLSFTRLAFGAFGSSGVCRLRGSLMGYGVFPSFWNLAARRFGLKLSLVSSREFEYRYHVVISKDLDRA